jgi:hypothetical protein
MAQGFWFGPWLCLERCGDDAKDIAYQINQLSLNRSRFTSALYELYNLGPNSTLVTNNLTDVTESIITLGLESWPMISSYPYPPHFLNWMRELFAAPTPFINACIAAAKARHFTGFNVDWEPPSGANATQPTKEDAAAYAAFLDTFATALHAEGILLSVDVAGWSEIWDLKAIGLTGVDRVMYMGTYTKPDDVWLQQLALAMGSIPASKLVIGLETDNMVNATGVALRFAALKKAKVSAVGVWRAGIPTEWWGEVDAWEAQVGSAA